MESDIPLISLPKEKISILKKCPVPRFYIYIERYTFDPTNKYIYYIIDIGIQRGQIIHSHKVYRRFSEIKKFDKLIRQTFDDTIYLKECPPIKIINNKKKNFLERRRQGLQEYFSSFILIPDILSNIIFQQFFEVNKSFLAPI